VLKELILRNRCYRRFFQEIPIDLDKLRTLVDYARLSASGRNLQPLKYALSNMPKQNELIFPHLSWAGDLKDWSGPEVGERPSAYIIIIGDKDIKPSFGIDPGIAAQSILLGATEMGYGGCIIGSIQRKELANVLSISDQFEILYVIVLGKPKERVIVDRVGGDGDIKYWRDEEDAHHVPKRSLEEIIVNIEFQR
jgi:nitroreductase